MGQGTGAAIIKHGGILMPDKRIEVDELAKELGVNRVTVYRWITSGWLPASKHGRKWMVDPKWIEWLKLWRDHQTHATKAIGFRLAPDLFDVLTEWSKRGGMTVQKTAVWLWLRGLQAEGKDPPGFPFLIENPEVEALVREHAKQWNVDEATAAAWLIVRGAVNDGDTS